MKALDPLADLVGRLLGIRDRLGDPAYRQAVLAARSAVGRSVLATAEGAARKRRPSGGKVIRLPVEFRERPPDGPGPK